MHREVAFGATARPGEHPRIAEVSEVCPWVRTRDVEHEMLSGAAIGACARAHAQKSARNARLACKVSRDIDIYLSIYLSRDNLKRGSGVCW